MPTSLYWKTKAISVFELQKEKPYKNKKKNLLASGDATGGRKPKFEQSCKSENLSIYIKLSLYYLKNNQNSLIFKDLRIINRNNNVNNLYSTYKIRFEKTDFASPFFVKKVENLGDAGHKKPLTHCELAVSLL